jgi:hypothetical protein
MAGGTPGYEGRIVEVGWGFMNVLLDSRALRWMVPGTVL